MTAAGSESILILTGPPGVGKTTVAGILAARFERSVHLEADEFFRFVRGGYVEPWEPESAEQNEIVMGAVAGAAADYAAGSYFTIVDGIVIPTWYLEPVRDALNGAGHPVSYAVLRAPLSICLERVQGREGRPSVDPSVIEQLWQSFADLGRFEGNAIDAGDRDPDEAADLIGQRLADGVLAI